MAGVTITVVGGADILPDASQGAERRQRRDRGREGERRRPGHGRGSRASQQPFDQAAGAPERVVGAQALGRPSRRLGIARLIEHPRAGLGHPLRAALLAKHHLGNVHGLGARGHRAGAGALRAAGAPVSGAARHRPRQQPRPRFRNPAVVAAEGGERAGAGSSARGGPRGGPAHGPADGADILADAPHRVARRQRRRRGREGDQRPYPDEPAHAVLPEQTGCETRRRPKS
jgi:hypothetical protein